MERILKNRKVKMGLKSSWLERNHTLNTGEAIYPIQMRMLLMLNQVQLKKKMRFTIQILNMSQVSAQGQKTINMSHKMSLSVGLRKNRKLHPQQSLGETRRTTKQYSESLFILEKTVKRIMM